MKLPITFVCLLLVGAFSCKAQQNSLSQTADHFVNLLDVKQKSQAVFPFDTSEKFVWGYVPKDDRKGISMNDMNETQKQAALNLMKASLSEVAYKKATSIMQLEKVLKVIENRAADDHYRDPGKYFISFFGQPSTTKVWGWRLDGHHLSFSFSSANNQIVSGTPGFMGANPAVVLSGPEQGLEILKSESELGLELLRALTKEQLAKTIFSTTAPNDILTTTMRHAAIKDPTGLAYSEMTSAQKNTFMQLLNNYIQRYTKRFASAMMADIEKAGLNNLLFSWAGSTEAGPGHPKYYRIQGPTIIIEYDNTQNNGNHVHTVIRDLKNDFGDQLMQHYERDHK